MNQIDQNINKDMIDSDLIDVESLDLSDDQTWLCVVPEDRGQKVDIVDWNLSLDWPTNEDNDYLKLERELYAVLDSLLNNDLAPPDKHKFDPRTYVKPKKRVQRPSIQSIVEVPSNPSSISPHPSLNQTTNKYLTYNKYSSPLGPISPMLRLKTFNVDVNTDNSNVVKEYAMKRKSLVQDDDPQLEDVDITATESSSRLSAEHITSRPINIDLSQPVHNLHNTFNKGLSNMMNERASLNMYQSGESLMRMSPPSLVSSLLMESSGTFNPESLDSRKSLASHRDSGIPTSGRDSIDPMMTSMTLSILDEKDMSTSFLSQTTYPDNDSLMDSLPPSLVSSVNSSLVVSNTSKLRADNTDSNVFSSTTVTHLEQSEKLLSARPRCNPYNNFTKRESALRNSESYTKSREETSQMDTTKILNENTDKKDSLRMIPKSNPEMGETITLNYSNNKFRRGNDAEKENVNATFEKSDAFYKDMGMQRTVDLGKTNSNITLDKQELNEIIQARQKLSLARKALPSEPEKISNHVDLSPNKTIQLPNQTITVPKQSMENASELLSRRRVMNTNGYDKPEEVRETPKRSATFKKVSPRGVPMDTTVVYVKDEGQMIDINSATLNLIDATAKPLDQQDWGSQERAMVGSNESTDTATFSSSSPPDSVPETQLKHHPHIASAVSTPLVSLKKGSKKDFMDLHNTISPILDTVNDVSYTLAKAPPSSNSPVMERTYDTRGVTVINSATMVKRTSAKRDILTGRISPDKKNGPNVSPSRIPPTGTGPYGGMAPPTAVPRKTSLPTSKLRQYSSHRELNRIPGPNPTVPSRISSLAGGRTMVRRGVYASNPALSPTAPVAPSAPPLVYAPPTRTDSYTVALNQEELDKPRPLLVRQGTETLRRERPQSQLVAPRDPPTTRPYSMASATQLRVSRPASVPTHRPVPGPSVVDQPRPTTGGIRDTRDTRDTQDTRESRVSALPRPSRLPAPRRTGLRPPSVYSVAPTADMDHY